MRSYCGGLVTIIIQLLIISFALFKLEQLVSRSSPDINVHVERHHFGSEDIFDTSKERSFKFAIGLEDYVTHEIKNDLSKVKWFAQYMNQTNNVL